jgi:hypothetical protein
MRMPASTRRIACGVVMSDLRWEGSVTFRGFALCASRLESPPWRPSLVRASEDHLHMSHLGRRT